MRRLFTIADALLGRCDVWIDTINAGLLFCVFIYLIVLESGHEQGVGEGQRARLLRGPPAQPRAQSHDSDHVLGGNQESDA